MGISRETRKRLTLRALAKSVYQTLYFSFLRVVIKKNVDQIVFLAATDEHMVDRY